MQDQVIVAMVTVGIPAMGGALALAVRRSQSIRQVRLSEIDKYYLELKEEVKRLRASEELCEADVRKLERRLSQCYRVFRGLGAEIRALRTIIEAYRAAESAELKQNYKEQMDRVIEQMLSLMKDAYRIEDGEDNRIGDSSEKVEV